MNQIQYGSRVYNAHFSIKTSIVQKCILIEPREEAELGCVDRIETTLSAWIARPRAYP